MSKAIYKIDGNQFANQGTYDPTQKATRVAKRLTIYKGGLIHDVEIPTRMKELKELEDKVYRKQLFRNSRWIHKEDVEVTTGATFGAPAWLNVIYGRKAWACVNHEANVFALLPKVAWGQTGWRVECEEAGAARSGGVKEKSQLPDTVAPGYEEVMARPRTVMHGFDLSEVAEFVSATDDALDILPELREKLGLAHRHHINEMLCANVNTAPAAPNYESIDRVMSSFAEVTNCGDVAAGDSDIYRIDRDAAASACHDAIVNHNSNVDRDLTLAIIDNTLQQIWANGGDPKVIITGYDTLMTWSQLLEAERRYLETARVVPTFGGVRGPAAGVEGGFLVAMYMGKPILPTQDAVVDTISRIYFADTDFLKFAVAKPTRYMETGLNEDMIYMNILGMEGWYETIGELRCYCFNKQGKIRDIR